MTKVIVVLLIILGGGYWFVSTLSQEQGWVSSTPAPSISSPTPLPTLTQPSSPSAIVGEVVELTVEGGSYYFNPNTITVKTGTTVKITLNSVDSKHDFVIDELGVASAIIEEGETTIIEFTPDKVGEFEYYCSVGEHREHGMVGTLIVTE